MKNIIIIGPSRTGKTELSSYIAKKLGYSILRVDKFFIGFNVWFARIGFHL